MVYNCECGGREADIGSDLLADIGYRVLLYPGILVRAVVAAGAEALAKLTDQSGDPKDLAEVLDADGFLNRFR